MLKNTLAAIGLLALVALASAALFREFPGTEHPPAVDPTAMPQDGSPAPQSQPTSPVGRYQIAVHPTPQNASGLYLLDTREGRVWTLINSYKERPDHWRHMTRLDTDKEVAEWIKSWNEFEAEGARPSRK